MVKPNDVPPIPDGHPHVYPVNPAPVWKIPMTQSNIELRDWFAGMAMQGMLAESDDYTWKSLSAAAYECADQMLKAREAK